jgi:RNA polymerase sigma-70 factor (ECF subfamily)
MTLAFTSEHSFPLRHVVNDSALTQLVSVHPLTCRMREGSDEAWDEFHQRYYLMLLRYAGSCSPNSADATEIVQQAYLRIARHIKPFKDETEFGRWLLCVVRCTALDHQRGIVRRAVLLEKLAHWQASQHSNSHHEQFSEPAVIAQEALAKFNEEDAQLLMLKYCEGWTVDELASKTATTPKAIENRLARLRLRLREMIAKIQ